MGIVTRIISCCLEGSESFLRAFVYTTVLLLVSCASLDDASASNVGVEYSSGKIDVKSENSEEIEKTGDMNLIRVYSYVDYSRLNLSLGLGLQSSEITGIDHAKGVKQFYSLKAPTLDVGAHFRTWYGLYLGLLIRNQVGKGASYGIEDEGKVVYVLSTGPSIFYRMMIGNLGVNAGFVLMSASGKGRSSTTQAFSVGLSYTFDEVAKKSRD
ncbi:MAG: hypothetical protein EOP07_11275 [Proteobacteria bacterium]|nr:MAG: hypothetical protein EOP07_11275 [Pseudomonadota bacterium]